MGLFDVLDDISGKQVMKTETGDNRIFGVIVGRVVDNYDKEMLGRVCVTVPTRDSNANELKWARVAMPYSGSKWGFYFLPEVGDQVLLAFEQGNIEKPYVVGCIPKDNDRILTQSANPENEYKKIVTKNGNMIYMEDNKEGEGTKDKIFIETSKKGHCIELDNEKNVILISDKERKNLVQMQTENGQMEIKAAQKLTIQVGESIEVILNGSNGNISIKSTKLSADMTGNIDINSNTKVGITGSNVAVESNAMMKLNSGGAMTLGGTPIKIG